ncbi:MAG: hypothetical protein ABI680_02130 [Chthoniobacteraceae bacterium]
MTRRWLPPRWPASWPLPATRRGSPPPPSAICRSLHPLPARPGGSSIFATLSNVNEAADDEDPDRDGAINLLERALGLDPMLPDYAVAGKPQLGIGGSWLSLTYQRSLAATDLQFRVLWSNDLVNWSDIGVIDALISSTATLETREGKVPLSDLDPEHAFLKLEVK